MIERHQAISDRRPSECCLFQPLIRHHQPGAVPIEQLQPVGALRAKDKHGSGERLLTQFILHQRCQPVMTLSEVHRLRRHHDPHPVRRKDHETPFRAWTISEIRLGDVAAPSRIATSPWTISSQSTGSDGAVGASGSITTGANSAPASSGTTNLPSRARRRHSDRWFGRIPTRRATSFTVTPGTSVSATSWPLSASDQRRLPSRPIKTSWPATDSKCSSRWTPIITS
ncbi:hypothetical protein RKLH11_2131 [Rhodobacteraceae bacterium KLH11]|nr:conserved hypothetical protein [Rhodobacteraceae bacterium KLH11]EEE35120.1 conserved hypothetical protein [Rhodobacteraceae bacterium KLH11]EEE35193.1 conserved hypothetical protein [Rhodobacteraceae bacterium KLH11]EEE35356.1 conserved hypothetical protein [Rhodobacteraceae bacterium KLH11]EEE35428.1 conserved hypothetical protein [Rhodobacteraceae bacterium KLH11]